MNIYLQKYSANIFKQVHRNQTNTQSLQYIQQQSPIF